MSLLFKKFIINQIGFNYIKNVFKELVDKLFFFLK